MIVIVPTTYQIRIFNDEMVDVDKDPYDAIMTLTFITSEVVFIKGFHGNVKRRAYRELLDWFLENKIKRVIAERVDGKSLPFSKEIGNDLFELDLEKLHRRVNYVDKNGTAGT